MSYVIMFWGNSSHSSVIFKMQKRVIRIIMGYSHRESCRELFKELKILTLSSQYVFSLLMVVVNNRDYFVSNSVYHNINTRQKKIIYTYLRYLWPCIRREYYSGIKIFNSLPKAIKDISSKPKKFKIALKHYLLTHSFYSLDEFFSKQ
jgi:formate/nitrite transporter FocA (FNT family)